MLRVDTGGKRNEEPLMAHQISEVISYAESLGMPAEKIVHYDWMNTFYSPAFDELVIGTDILPSPNPKSANSALSLKASVAHEVAGHRDAALKGFTQADEILEEIQASIRAARFATDLADSERWILLRDAVDRLPEGVRMRHIRDSLNISER